MNADFQLFENLAGAEFEAIKAHAVPRNYPANTIIVTEGDDTSSLYLVESGKVKFYLNDEDGNEVMLGKVGAGGYFGELAVLDGAPRSVSVMTLEPTKLAVVSRKDLLQTLRADPEFCLRLLSRLAERLRHLSDEVRSLALTNVYSRITRLLKHLAHSTDGKSEIPERLTHQQIAQMVGSSREMVSRIMKDLQEGEYVIIAGGRIKLNKPFPRRW